MPDKGASHNKMTANRPFNSYAAYCKQKYGERLQKISIDAGFTCSNRNGTAGTGGCTYCDNNAFNPSYCTSTKPIMLQIEEGIEFHLKRYRRANKYIAYFQPYSNTYASLNHLKKIYEQALSHPLIAGLAIGTRPDCIDEEKLDYLKYLANNHIISLEIGIESCYDQTLKRINRGHDFGKTAEALEQIKKFDIFCGGHIIFGLPGETVDMMLAEADILSDLPINMLKFHQLQVLRNTAMEKEYESVPDDFHHFSLDGYIEFIIDFLERISPEIIIERLAGEVPPRFLLNNYWGRIRYDQVLSMIEKQMLERASSQGIKFIKKNKN
jgi:radical SAM protein (TIGR01212 family)